MSTVSRLEPATSTSTRPRVKAPPVNSVGSGRAPALTELGRSGPGAATTMRHHVVLRGTSPQAYRRTFRGGALTAAGSSSDIEAVDAPGLAAAVRLARTETDSPAATRHSAPAPSQAAS